jgi:hypothetical protein
MDQKEIYPETFSTDSNTTFHEKSIDEAYGQIDTTFPSGVHLKHLIQSKRLKHH